MDIKEVQKKAVDSCYEKSVLDRGSCERAVNRAFQILLEELERSFDENESRHWGSWEISDILFSMRISIK